MEKFEHVQKNDRFEKDLNKLFLKSKRKENKLKNLHNF